MSLIAGSKEKPPHGDRALFYIVGKNPVGQAKSKVVEDARGVSSYYSAHNESEIFM